MLYGEELFIRDNAAEGGSPVNMNATGAVYSPVFLKPGVVRAFGYRVTTSFAYDTLVQQGILALYHYARKIVTIAVGNSGGTGYAAGDTFSVTQLGAANGVGVVTTVAAGVVTGVKILPASHGVPGGWGYNYYGASNLATVALTGAGSGLTVTITDKVLLQSLDLLNGTAAGRVVVINVPNLVVNEVPTQQGKAHFNMGDSIVVEVSQQATGGTYLAGAFQPFIHYHNRGDSYSGQDLVVDETPVPEVTGSWAQVG